MFPVKAGLPGLPALNIPNVCTEQLQPKSAFCPKHHEVAASRGYPTTIRDFLKHCGVTHCKAKNNLYMTVTCVVSPQLYQMMKGRI